VGPTLNTASALVVAAILGAVYEDMWRRSVRISRYLPPRRRLSPTAATHRAALLSPGHCRLAGRISPRTSARGNGRCTGAAPESASSRSSAIYDAYRDRRTPAGGSPRSDRDLAEWFVSTRHHSNTRARGAGDRPDPEPGLFQALDLEGQAHPPRSVNRRGELLDDSRPESLQPRSEFFD